MEAATSIIVEHPILELIIGKVPFWLRRIVGIALTKGLGIRCPVTNQVIRERKFIYIYKYYIWDFFNSINEDLRSSVLSNRSGSRGDRLKYVMVSDNVCLVRTRSGVH